MKIGLALSGGGALGAAHIGVLEALEKSGIQVDCIAGTSAGAIIGLLYADGGLPRVNQFIDELDSAGIINRTSPLLAISPDRLFDRIQNILGETVGALSFDDLPKEFACVATDISTGEMVVLDEGDPVSAVMASAAYPGAFRIQKFHGRYLVDGGSTRNLPADIVREMQTDFVIGSSLYGLSKIGDELTRSVLSRIQMMIRALVIMERAMSNIQVEQCDFCFTPPVETFRWFEFNRFDEILAVGRKYASGQMKDLRNLLRSRKS